MATDLYTVGGQSSGTDSESFKSKITILQIHQHSLHFFSKHSIIVLSWYHRVKYIFIFLTVMLLQRHLFSEGVMAWVGVVTKQVPVCYIFVFIICSSMSANNYVLLFSFKFVCNFVTFQKVFQNLI